MTIEMKVIFICSIIFILLIFIFSYCFKLFMFNAWLAWLYPGQTHEVYANRAIMLLVVLLSIIFFMLWLGMKVFKKIKNIFMH